MKNKRIIGSALLFLTAVIWGTAFVAQRVGAEKVEPATLNATRMLIAAFATGVVALVIDLAKRRKAEGEDESEKKSKRKYTVIGGLLCGLFLTASTNLQQIGLVYTAAGKAGFITAMYILLVPVLSFLLFRKKSPPLVWCAVAVGMVGMYLLCIKEGFGFERGDAFVLGAALMFSGHIICCDRFVSRGDPVKIASIQFSVVAVISGAIALIAEEPSWDKIASAIIPILYCGAISGGVGYTLQLVGQKYTDPTVASMIMSLEAVFAALSGALILGESMSPREAIGCAVMFLATVTVQLPPIKKRKNTNDTPKEENK